MAEPRRIPEQLIEEIRSRLPILDVVGRSVALKRTGGWHKGLCPFHGERSPSFAVHPVRKNFHCFGCGAHGDVIRFVMRAEGLSFPDAARRCAEQAGMAGEIEGAIGAAPWAARKTAPAPAVPPAPARPMDRIAAAWRIWDRAKPIAPDGIVARYLRGRGLHGVEDLAPVLRGAMLRHPDTAEAEHPCMVARVDGPDGRFAGIHRTYLAARADGSIGKLAGVANAKLTLGDLMGGAIRLHPAGACLGLSEGIETAIAAWNLSGVPVWACISTSGLVGLGLPFDVEHAIVFADRDAPHAQCPEGWGLRAARKLADRLKADAVRCEIRLPLAPHGDYADVLAAMRSDVAA